MRDDRDKQPERRRTPRYPFLANAEITQPISDKHVFARVREISLNGCYLTMADPFPASISVFVKLFSETDYFESSATVVYSQPNLGMAVAFREVNHHFMPTLHKWLLEAMRAASETAVRT